MLPRLMLLACATYYVDAMMPCRDTLLRRRYLLTLPTSADYATIFFFTFR